MLNRLSALVLCFFAFGCQNEVDSSPKADHIRVAQSFLTQLDRADFNSASQALSDSLRSQVDAEKLGKDYAELVGKHGKLKSVSGVRGARLDAYDVLYLKSLHGDHDVDLRLVFKDGDKIAGLWFRPSDPKKSYKSLQ